MGLVEHQLGGGFVGRKSVTLTSTAGQTYYTGSTTELGRTFIILSALPSIAPGRIRLYMNSSSRNLVTEISRSFETKSIDDSIAVLADISFSAGTGRAFGIDPMLYGATLQNNTNQIYYTIETAGNLANSIQLSSFLLEDNLDSNPSSEYAISNRRNVVLSSDSMISGARFLGSASISTGSSGVSIVNTSTPKTYLLLSASSFPNPVSQSCRVRLYSIPLTSVPSTEISRSFNGQPTSGSGLIVDFLIESGAKFLPFTPISFGSNLSTVLTSQNLTETPVQSEVYYIIDNLHTASVQHNVHLGIYSLED
jgi:hypothetical protein